MQPKTERFEMRLDQGILDRLDAWRSGQDGLPSRAEAVRRLVEAGVGRSGDTAVQLSDGEKLIVMLLCELYKGLDIEGEIDPEFIEGVLSGGHDWALSWKYPGLFHGQRDQQATVREVLDVLEMWSFIEAGYEKLPKAEKERVANDVGLLGERVRFSGFDGNHETEHLGIAEVFVDDLGRFSEFKGRDLNAHRPTLEVYRRMLGAFKPLRSQLVGGGLNTSQIILLLKEQTHPDDGSL